MSQEIYLCATQVLLGLTILQLYEGLADQLTDIVVNAVRLISLVVFL